VPKIGLQPIENTIKIHMSYKNEMQKHKGEDEGKQTLYMMICHVVLICTKPPPIHFDEALTQEYYFLVTKSLPRHPLTYHKGLLTKVRTKLLDHLDVVFT
jgi:hypothetical protein